MLDNIEKIRQDTLEAIEKAGDLRELDGLRVRILGKKGELTALLRGMGGLSPEERPKAGQLVNALRERIDAALAERIEKLAKREKEIRLRMEEIDVSLPGKQPPVGAPHPLTLTQEKMIEIFTSMGFSVAEGPDIEFDKYNFELLNLPPNHPARDAQDTFYIEDHVVLRTHTSPVQARVMTTQKPPIRIICPGRTYRVDDDATHSPMFSQCEGLIIDEHITMGDLKGTLDVFASEFFGEGIKTRFRPSFFPFTEPSAEVDLTCAACKGAGCRLCNGTGWIEVLGAGMVNPKVLDLCGIDSTKYAGFAFGIGIERVTNIRYNIRSMRALFENDARFLSQFVQGRDV